MSIAEQVGSTTDAFGPVGAQLAKARAARGWTIDEICRRTNIRPAVVLALEAGDIGPSGGAVYARGHVRSLAHALGMETAPLLAAFDATHGTGSPPPPVLISDNDEAEVSIRPSGPRVTGPRWPLVMGAVLVVVIVIALVQLLVPGSKDAAKRATVAPPAAVKHSAAATRKAPAPPSLIFPVPAQGVTLRVVLTSAPSWLDVTDERGVQLIQRVVAPSSKALDLHAAGMLRVTIGAAGAAAVSCNGHPLGPLGGPTQVVSLTLTRGTAQCPGS
jgi:cytoskeleton protein RodZ